MGGGKGPSTRMVLLEIICCDPTGKQGFSAESFPRKGDVFTFVGRIHLAPRQTLDETTKGPELFLKQAHPVAGTNCAQISNIILLPHEFPGKRLTTHILHPEENTSNQKPDA